MLISNDIQWATKRRLEKALSILLLNDISKYLGCSIIQNRIKKSSFLEVIIKSQKKLTSRKARFLSRASKIVLIKVNLGSSPLPIMNYFKFTKRINEDLDKINKKFL